MVAIPLFAGTKRETLWDRNNLVGLLLIGFALLFHGGFETYLRSSPRLSFSGYVLGWGRSQNGSGWASIYDLGYPPTKKWSDGAAFRAVHVPWSKTNPVPEEVWSVRGEWLIQLTYRVRDLEVISMRAVPVPALKAAGITGWEWQSRNERLVWPATETALGIVCALAASFIFMHKREVVLQSSLRINPYVSG